MHKKKLFPIIEGVPGMEGVTGKLVLDIDMVRFETQCTYSGDLAVLIAGLAESMKRDPFIYHAVTGAVEIYKSMDWEYP